MHAFIDNQMTRARKGDGAESKKERTNVLDELAWHIRDPIALRYQAIGVTLPAMDAISIATGYALSGLACHRYYWRRLREIALSANEPLSFEEPRSSKFILIRYVIQENIRHIGPAARIWRKSPKLSWQCVLVFSCQAAAQEWFVLILAVRHPRVGF